jgi:hypothetical protein
MTEPEPSPRGITLRWPDNPDLHARIKASADANRRSINSEILWLIELGLATNNAPPWKPQR